MTIVLCAASLIALAGIGILYTIGLLPYVYCLARESQWLASTTEAQLDSQMVFSPKRTIAPAESGWGQKYELKPGERMVQYRILNRLPLEAVFDRDSKVVCFFTSYE